MSEITLDALARDSGTFLMVAMDQRESLRSMFAQHFAEPIADERLVNFKLDVARELSPHASGFLIDQDYGFHEVVRQELVPESCGLLLAADALVQEPGGLVEDTDLDAAVDAAAAREAGADGLKLLVIWRDDEDRARRLELSRRFVELCERNGLLSVLEGIVRTAPEERDAAIVAAAQELSSVGPSLYKVEVPLHGKGPAEEIERRCAEIDAEVPMPWVVLSNGVEPADFPTAVEAACRAGASGMLAGRAIWSDVVGEEDPVPLLRERSVERLQSLASIVDAHGRPWRQDR
jgi:sulfofructosephosphate aldolase